jgi:transposase
VTEVSTIGLDLAKMVFQVHGADASGAFAFRKTLRRAKVLEFFRDLPRCVVAMEACGGHIIGLARSVGWDMRCGSSRPFTSNRS